MGLKIAAVFSCPSADAKPGHTLSEFEETVTNELARDAGFKPDAVFVASRAYFNKPTSLFVGKPYASPPTSTTENDRRLLQQSLEGYDLALTFGVHALWATTGLASLETYRGTHIDSVFVPGLQVVPTYDPSIYAYAAWAERPIVRATMRKAMSRFVDKPRTIYVPEKLEDFEWFEKEFIRQSLVFDVETNKACRITEFSIATSSAECLYVQLEDRMHKAKWSAEDELWIWCWLDKLAKNPSLSWGFHNAIYDLTYLDQAGIHPLGPIFDTMLRHHAFQPEWEKSLGFLASLHLPTRAWKHLRTKAKKEFGKQASL